MKISAYDEDKLHWRRFFKDSPAIFLDGSIVSNVFFADEEAGVIDRYVSNENGSICFDKDEALTERLVGVVKIVGIKRDGSSA